MTASELKMLGQLPKMVEVLRKLSKEAEEIGRLASSLSLGPSAVPGSGTAPGPSVRGNGGEAAPHAVPAFRPPPTMRGLRERLPDFGPQPVRTAQRQALDDKLDEVRNDPGRAEKLAQFAHDGAGDDEDMDA